jgi:Asp-tRNA(Asn)/Glu-tRNA(Gln) amidotransferase A subunit family amidase
MLKTTFRPIARDIRDVAITLQVIAEPEPRMFTAETVCMAKFRKPCVLKLASRSR